MRKKLTGHDFQDHTDQCLSNVFTSHTNRNHQVYPKVELKVPYTLIRSLASYPLYTIFYIVWQKDEKIYALSLWNLRYSILKQIEWEKLSRRGNDCDNAEKFLNLSIFYVGELFYFKISFCGRVTSIYFKKLIAPIM